MQENLKGCEAFLEKHHVLSLATFSADELSVCNLFYAYDMHTQTFIVASSDDTTHIQNILINNKVAGSVVLETKTIAKIQGLQFRGKVDLIDDKNYSKLYFKSFPHAIVMRPKLWKIKVNYFKLTDNTLGFGKKLIWRDS